MIDKGIYYFWVTSITLDEHFQSITRWFQTELNKYPEEKEVFPAKIWYNSGRRRNNLNVSSRKRWDSKIDKQLQIIEKDVENKAAIYTLSQHLLPLERKGFWCEELEILLATYRFYFEESLKEGLKRKCNWLKGYIQEKKISLEEKDIFLQIEREKIARRYYRSYYEKKIVITKPENFSNNQIEWLLKTIGDNGQIQKTHFVNYYPIYKLLFKKTSAIVSDFELEERITKKWGSL